MIGLLRGTVVEKRPPQLVLDVGGVGYEVEAPLSAFFDLPEGELVLHTHLVVRDDAHLLFGFRSRGERDLFRALIRVNGVGPKLALTILSGMDGEHFARAVQAGDVKSLVALPGVGRKTAERLVVEMRDRLAAWIDELAAVSTPGSPVAPAAPDKLRDAEDALVALGYKPAEAARLVAAVDREDIGDSEELIRLALRSTVRS
jgi:Holliday junction DNA helicase RuvA